MSFVQIGRRRTIQAPRIEDNSEEDFAQEGISIKAEISADEQRCTFTLNQPIFPGRGWWYPSAESAEGSPLAEVLLAIDDVQSLVISDNVVEATRGQLCFDEWEPTAQEIGAEIRSLLLRGEAPVAQSIIDKIPPEEDIYRAVQEVIEDVLNPGVASHGGVISLVEVKGNNIWVNMGGGCQGCSAAAVTLRQGVEGELRKKVPFLGAINDSTDHAAGVNPYMS